MCWRHIWQWRGGISLVALSDSIKQYEVVCVWVVFEIRPYRFYAPNSLRSYCIFCHGFLLCFCIQDPMATPTSSQTPQCIISMEPDINRKIRNYPFPLSSFEHISAECPVYSVNLLADWVGDNSRAFNPRETRLIRWKRICFTITLKFNNITRCLRQCAIHWGYNWCDCKQNITKDQP